MIRVELAELVFLYLLVFLAAILAVWIAYEMVRRVRENRSRYGRLRCAVCTPPPKGRPRNCGTGCRGC